MMMSLMHVVRSRNYTNPRQQRQMLALVLELPDCFDWWLFFLIVYASYTCLQSMASSRSFHIVFSDLTPIIHLLKLVRLLVSIIPASPSELIFTYSLRGKVHPKRISKFCWQRIKAVTLSAFLYVLNEFEWTMVSDLSNLMLKRLLLIDFVASTATGHSAKKALERKDKKSLPLPVRLQRFDQLICRPS